MTEQSTHELIQRFAHETRELTRLLATQRLQPLLGLALTVHQLKIVLLVATGAATTGKDLAEHLHVTPATVSASVDKLVDLGYLRRDPIAGDRRIKHLAASPLATRLYDEFLDKRDAPDEVIASLDPDDLAALVQGVAALRSAVERRSRRSTDGTADAVPGHSPRQAANPVPSSNC